MRKLVYKSNIKWGKNVHSCNILMHIYKLVNSNNGAVGVDVKLYLKIGSGGGGGG